MIFWLSILLILLAYAAGLGVMYTLIGRKQRAVDRLLAGNLKAAENERATKQHALEELGGVSLGLVSTGQVSELTAKSEELEESIRAEKGRITITEAELEAMDMRLRELEELKRELEVSNMDAIKELEMLRSQERDIAAKNEALRAQLTDTGSQIDILLDMLAHSTEAVRRLTAAKTELLNTEKKASAYEEQIAQINRRYMELKKAYDALDIEYAQLYEKQQASSDE